MLPAHFLLMIMKIQVTRKERKKTSCRTHLQAPYQTHSGRLAYSRTKLFTLLSVHQAIKRSSHSYPACTPPPSHRSHIPLIPHPHILIHPNNKHSPLPLCISLIKRRRTTPPPLPTRIPIPPFGENLPRNRLEAQSQCGRNRCVGGEGGPGVRSWVGDGGEGRERDGGGLEG